MKTLISACGIKYLGHDNTDRGQTVPSFSPQPEEPIFLSLCLTFASGLGRGTKMVEEEGQEEGGRDSSDGRNV